ncbi:hypothetical protein [Bradyrhizobium prioriisuperbiae]|uniref:hypothetical protein n=1 Tax=Bradyrhizobium prioriisuperbiae TaxID=2854389 RepID=UPI0028F0EC79|nr:hypothetical protein [Bradyrhizobium prioritasuperba]
MPNSISAGQTTVDRPLLAPGDIVTVTTSFNILQNLGNTAFNVQLTHIASSQTVGATTKGVPAADLTTGATVSMKHSFTIPANAPTGPYSVVLTANTADSNWTLLFEDDNAAGLLVQTAAVKAGPTSTSPSTVILGHTITVATSFTVLQNLGTTAFTIQLFHIASDQSIGIHTEGFTPSQVTSGSIVPLSHTFTIPVNVPTGDYRVSLTANVADSNFTLLYVLPIAQAFSVQTAAVSIFPKAAGAFVNWGDDGRESNMAIWEDWLNQTSSSVRAMDFYGGSVWSDFFDNDWLPGFWLNVNPDRKLVWSIPLTVSGTPLADIGAGLHDAEFINAATKIAAAQPDAIIRIGWEMNIAGGSGTAVNQTADYIEAYRRVVAIFRAQSSAFTFDWCPGWGAQDMPADQAYPGDDVVDYIGLDVYDYVGGTSVQQRWIDNYLNAPFGLTWHKTFAAAHGKPISYPEWGVGQAGDNPYFIQQMHAWLTDNAGQLAYACYFDVDGAWPTQIDNGEFPLSQAQFVSLFSAP